jgi:hypothetical protein
VIDESELSGKRMRSFSPLHILAFQSQRANQGLRLTLGCDSHSIRASTIHVSRDGMMDALYY